MSPSDELFASFEVRGPREAILAVWARVITFENAHWHYADPEPGSGGVEATVEICTIATKPEGVLWLYLDAAGIGVGTIASSSSQLFTREKRELTRDLYIADVLEPIVAELGAQVTITKTMAPRTLGVRAL